VLDVFYCFFTGDFHGKRLKKKYGPWYAVFENIRSMFCIIVWDNWEEFYELLLEPETHPPSNWYGVPMEVKR